MIEVSWTALKSVLTAKAIKAQGAEDAQSYTILAIDGPLIFKTVMLKANANADLADFETNYKPTWNPVIDPRIDGFPMNRPATTKPGWHYCPRYLTWTTAKHNGLHNMKIDTTTDWGDASVRFWNNSGTELKRTDYASDSLFQTALTAACTLTALDWHSTFDYDLVGCVFLNGQRPNSAAWAYVVAAPDVPGGVIAPVPFLDGGFPLHLLADYSFIDFHGITTKRVTADPTLKTNKFRLLVDHATGVQVTMSMGFKKFNL